MGTRPGAALASASHVSRVRTRIRHVARGPVRSASSGRVAGRRELTRRRVRGRGAAGGHRPGPTARRAAPAGCHRRSGGTGDASK